MATRGRCPRPRDYLPLSCVIRARVKMRTLVFASPHHIPVGVARPHTRGRLVCVCNHRNLDVSCENASLYAQDRCSKTCIAAWFHRCWPSHQVGQVSLALASFVSSVGKPADKPIDDAGTLHRRRRSEGGCDRGRDKEREREKGLGCVCARISCVCLPA